MSNLAWFSLAAWAIGTIIAASVCVSIAEEAERRGYGEEEANAARKLLLFSWAWPLAIVGLTVLVALAVWHASRLFVKHLRKALRRVGGGS